MCIFTQPVTEVSGTSIFARKNGDKQILVYQMHLVNDRETAMVLPIPTTEEGKNEELKFYDLSQHKTFFSDLEAFFDPISKLLREDGTKGIGTLLKVHKVGSFEASYVPRKKDFNRLDSRFRLQNKVFSSLPQYENYSFVVFRLQEGSQDIHPMAFEFDTSYDGLYYPTVHMHGHGIPLKEKFDHKIYGQVAKILIPSTAEKEDDDSISGKELEEDYASPGEFKDLAKKSEIRSHGIINKDMGIFYFPLVGERKNEDLFL